MTRCGCVIATSKFCGCNSVYIADIIKVSSVSKCQAKFVADDSVNFFLIFKENKS